MLNSGIGMRSDLIEFRKQDSSNVSNGDSSAKRILLISNKVMHYRVSIYNYFHRRFSECGFELSVIADSLQKQNQRSLKFDFREQSFSFTAYKKTIEALQPDAVILFLRLKDLIIWPLIHWLKFKKIPFAVWTKAGNWDAKDSKLRYHLFNYVHGISDGIIVYSKDCLGFVKPRFRSKAFVANNTLNFEDFPQIDESKEMIKREFRIPFDKVVLFVGRMDTEKGRKRVDHLVDIFRSLERKDVGLVLVGSGVSEDLRARANPHNTIFLGEIHDEKDIGISKIFKMADICVIPGHVGLGLNQAFFWGLPVITEEGKHPPEIAYLKPGRNGFMVPNNDLVSLRDRIVFLLDHDDVRADFSKNAQNDIIAEASIENMFSGFKDCVQFLTQR
jgi:glycosyltransferase involved in cell wall biosynthesis